MRPPKVKLSQLIQLYNSGYSTHDIAKAVGVAQSSVYKRLRRAGIKMRKHGTRSPRIVIPSDNTILAYVAGLFDGEGSVVSYKGHYQVRIANTYKPVLEWLREVFKCGGITKTTPKCYDWKITRRADVVRFLKAIFPFVRIKKDVVLEALKCMRK